MTATNSEPFWDEEQELEPLRVQGGWISEDMGTGWSRHESGSLSFAVILIAVLIAVLALLFVSKAGFSL